MSKRKETPPGDRKSTRLNSSHANISYAVFCLKKKFSDSLLLIKLYSPSFASQSSLNSTNPSAIQHFTLCPGMTSTAFGIFFRHTSVACGHLGLNLHPFGKIVGSGINPRIGVNLVLSSSKLGMEPKSPDRKSTRLNSSHANIS